VKEALVFALYGGFFEKRTQDASYGSEEAAEYNPTRENTAAWIAETEVMGRFLDKLPLGMAVLDTPFGTGRYVDLYLRKGYSIVGLDKSEAMIKIAEETFAARPNAYSVLIGDIRNLPFSDHSFDLVVCSRFLPHIVNYQTALLALAEISRVTRRYAIVQLGERPTDAYRLRRPRADEKMGTWLYPNEIEEMLAGFGFCVLEKSEVVHDGVTIGRHYYRNPPGWRFYLCENSILHRVNE